MVKKLVTLLSVAFCCGKAAAAPLETGAKVPAVKALDQDGKEVDLGVELAKGITLVYFYPKASTPG